MAIYDRHHLVNEADLVRHAVRETVTAFASQDAEAARAVIASDDGIDDCYLRVEQEVQWLLARQTPVAIDLRRALAILHVNLHLERIADYCVTIAKLTQLTSGLPADRELEQAFKEMGGRAVEMVDAAVAAFLSRDVQGAHRLLELDRLINEANRRVVRQVLALGSDEARHEWGLRMIVVSRCLEQIGDHAVDIGEQTAYAVTGVFQEFTDASHRSELESGAPSA